MAAREGDLPIAAELIGQGANPDGTDKYGNSALHEISAGLTTESIGNPAADIDGILNLLLQKHARLDLANAAGKTPLHEAAQLNNVRIVEKFIAAGANKDARNTRTGETPLMDAAYYCNADVVDSLESAKADIEATAADGSTALIFALEGHCQQGASEKRKIIEKLLRHKANPNVKTQSGDTPLTIAVASVNDPGIVTDLIRSGAIPKTPGKDGKTPLQSAQELPSPEREQIVQILSSAEER